MNTIEKLGDDETFRQIVERSIASFKDNELPEVTRYPFYGCDKLADVSIPNTTTIEGYAFERYTNLNSLDLLKVTSMGKLEFYGGYLLPEISFPLLTTVLDAAAFGCTALSTFNLLKATEISESVFRNSGLTSTKFPLVISVAGYAFHDYMNLSTAKFSKATSIGDMASQECFSKASIIVGTKLNDEMAICALEGTDSFPSSTGAIYVPYNLQDKYKTATNWSSFVDKIKAYTGETA